MNVSCRTSISVFARCVLLLTMSTGIIYAKEESNRNVYGLLFELELTSDRSLASGTITVDQNKSLLREARFRAPTSRYSDFDGDGDVKRDGNFLIWRPPSDGGSLRYKVLIDNQRKSGSYDARVTRRWAMFRGDDVFPAATTRHASGARSRSKLRFKLPSNWSVVAPFKDYPDGKSFDVVNPERRFDRPIGWIVAGRLGVRRDTIENIEVAIAGPINHGIQRISMLALLRWTLPVLAGEAGSRPPYLSIVSANDAMWRGGLSAPNSVYVHAERPLLSENATSTLLHEIVHVLMPVPTEAEHDWIDEGLAEYLTLVTLRDSGTVSPDRFEQSIQKFERRGRGVKTLLTRHASGEVTARAVSVFSRLDRELQQETDGRKDIFDLVRALVSEPQPVGLARLRVVSAGLMNGTPAVALSDGQIPGTRPPP